MKKQLPSILFYGFFILLAAAGILHGQQLQTNGITNLRVLPWEALIWLIPVAILIWAQPLARLPLVWDSSINRNTRVYQPILIGLAFGVADYLVFEMLLCSGTHEAMPPYTQPFPYSLFLYGSGAFEVEVFYRLLPITLVLLVFTKIRKGKYWLPAFWSIAVLTALREPLEQMPGGAPLLIVYSLLTGFSMNLIQAIYYRKAGFSASVFVRLGHYLVWHIVNGILIEQQLYA